MASQLLMKQVVSIIDKRTTMVCLHAAGQIKPVNEAFETINGDYYNPPFHIHCRSIVSPWQSGYVSTIRKDANAEVQRRKPKYRRIGPNGEKPSLPPPTYENPRIDAPAPVDPARDVRVAAKKAKLQELLAALHTSP